MRKKPRRSRKKPALLTPEVIDECLEKGRRDAKELAEQLKRCFTLSTAQASLRLD